LNSIVYAPTGLTTTISTTTLTSSRISMLIDSTTPYIWLPREACDKFASEFGLRYDAQSELYTINSTAHAALKRMKPDITFTLSNTGGETLDIVIPYDAFDLTAKFPVIRNETAYFPIKDALIFSPITNATRRTWILISPTY
jgi:hypothetical protein